MKSGLSGQLRPMGGKGQNIQLDLFAPPPWLLPGSHGVATALPKHTRPSACGGGRQGMNDLPNDLSSSHTGLRAHSKLVKEG